jgi:PAS domain S-box-containing protein
MMHRDRQLEQETGGQNSAARFLAAIVESSDDAIVSKNLQGVIQSWNGGAERLFGYTAEEAIGRHVSLVIPADRMDEETQILARICANERVEHFETVRKRKDGRLIDVSLTISPIRDEAGHVIGASKIARDIGERKQAEERIYSLLAQLQKTDRLKDEFLAVLAHELRGPLAPLKNMLQIMKSAEGNVEVLKQVQSTMERQLSHLVRLVDDLIDVNRIARNKIELRLQQVELATVVQQSVEASRPLADIAGHELHVSLPPQPVFLNADPVRIAQVFSNLLNNACKYTRPGGRIWLTARREGSDVVVQIKDTGMGIPRDKLASVFEMFTQVDHTLERAQGGLGIGLTLVKRLVEMHGGSVEAHSEGVGRGSEFIVRLPIVGQTRKTPTGQPTGDSLGTAPRRVLIVDDNVDAATSLAMLLKVAGHETYTAHDGIAAVEQAEKQHPDFVLLDIGLPRLNGHEACRRIREHAWGKDMKLVALTGWGQEEDRQKSVEAGFDAHMVKPVDFAALSTLLAESEPATK